MTSHLRALAWYWAIVWVAIGVAVGLGVMAGWLPLPPEFTP
jgi:hypothetical protein